MKVTVEKLPKSEVKLTIEVPAERLEKFMQKAAEQISQHFKIPGFRPGHVPLDVLKQHVNEEGIEAHLELLSSCHCCAMIDICPLRVSMR